MTGVQTCALPICHSDCEKTGRNVFMVMTDKGVESVVTASEGHLDIQRGQRFLVLDRGERVQTELDTGIKTLSRFDSARLLIGDAPEADKASTDIRALSTPALLVLKQREAKAELFKKRIEAWRATAQRYESEPETNEGRRELMARARNTEGLRDKALAAYHQFEFGSAAFQIGIVLASASVITGAIWLALGAGVLGVVGMAFTALGLFAPTLIHL